jgi:hypothetical protein
MEGGTTELRTTTGLHDVRITADDYDADEEHVMVTRDHVAERVVLLTPHSADAVGHSGSNPDEQKSVPTQTILGGWVLGFAGVAIISGVVCGVRAISLANAYNDERPQDPSDRSTGIAFRTTADVLFATAIVSGGVGAYLILTAPKSSTSIAVGPAELRVRVAF